MRACCRLREWPHDAYREHIVDLLQRSGAAPSEVAELRERLIEARKVRLAEQGHVNKHHTITATPLLHHTTTNAPASAPANTGRVSPQPSSPLQQVCPPWDVMLCCNDFERSDAQPPQKVTIAPSLTTHSRGESKISSLDEHGECACALHCCSVALLQLMRVFLSAETIVVSSFPARSLSPSTSNIVSPRPTSKGRHQCVCPHDIVPGLAVT